MPDKSDIRVRESFFHFYCLLPVTGIMIDVLIKKSILNDHKAQRALYERHRQLWFMTCLRYGRDRKEAEDIFQDGLIHIFKKLDQFDASIAAFSTWSTKIMVNAALQYLRKWRRFDQRMMSEDYGHKVLEQYNVIDDLSAQELTKLIQNLPDGYRVVFNMYVIEGYKHREIAELLGISENTSKTQLFKAKASLRNQIEKLFQSNKL